MIPSTYRPKAPQDFIGSAHKQAHWIDRIVAGNAPSGSPMRLMLLGASGVGKSELSNYFAARLGCDRWHVHKYNGTQLRIEIVDEIARSFHYKDLFGAYRILSIEEVDKVPMLAQVRLLTLLDDLPDRTAVVCTSNCKLSELEERFQSRFTVLMVKGPDTDELASFLQLHWPAIPAQSLPMIAMAACGNVRQALKDADLALIAGLT
jgi:MoxR-like ATPase